MNKIPDFQTIMLPLLRLLQDDKPHPLQEVLQALTQHFNLSEEDLRITVPSGQQPMFKNRITWAITYLKNAGLVYYPQRGVYQITEAGKKVAQENINNISTSYLKKFDAYKKWQSSFSETEQQIQSHPSPDADKTPDEIIGDLMKILNHKLAIELLDILKGRPAADFEKFVLRVLSKMGYGGVEALNFEVVGRSGDNGIDGIIYQDQLGLDRVYVQAKRWAENKVQSKDIRDFIGALSLRGTNKGVFITTSDFTEDARQTVEKNPQNRIVLIDGEQLAGYAIKHDVGVQVKIAHQIKAIDNEFFDEL